MNKIIALVGLKREAILLDSRLFIVKAMVAISLGALLGQAFPLTRLDMVSVLLGVMYNLDAINVSGVRGGINQLLASALGALTTGALVYLTGYQVNFLVIALGIGLTLYIALKIDYRMVSPVAIFTSIYMTQLLQKNALGDPDILATFAVRISALGLGVAIALVSNFLFSTLYYRQLGKRRLEFVKIQGVLGLKTSVKILASEDASNKAYQPVLAGVFNDIEMVKANLEAMMQEKRIPFNKTEKENLIHYAAMVLDIKTIIHLAYDCLLVKETKPVSVSKAILDRLDQIIAGLEALDFTDLAKTKAVVIQPLSTSEKAEGDQRLSDNVGMMIDHYHGLIAALNQLKR